MDTAAMMNLVQTLSSLQGGGNTGGAASPLSGLGALGNLGALGTLGNLGNLGGLGALGALGGLSSAGGLSALSSLAPLMANLSVASPPLNVKAVPVEDEAEELIEAEAVPLPHQEETAAEQKAAEFEEQQSQQKTTGKTGAKQRGFDPALLTALGSLGSLLQHNEGTNTQFRTAEDNDEGCELCEDDDYCSCDKCPHPCPRRISAVPLSEVRNMAASFRQLR